MIKKIMVLCCKGNYKVEIHYIF